jgi:hypothetical protein
MLPTDGIPDHVETIVLSVGATPKPPDAPKN